MASPAVRASLRPDSARPRKGRWWGGGGAAGWLLGGGLGLLAAAAWAGRGAGNQVLLLVVLAGATAVLVATAGWKGVGSGGGGILGSLLGAVLVFMAAVAVAANRAIARIEEGPPAIEAEVVRTAASEFDAQVEEAAAWAREAAARALRLPNGRVRPFAGLAALTAGEAAGERAVVLYRSGIPWAWTGTLRQPTESLTASLGVAMSQFYISLYARADSGNLHAVATQLLHARRPADVLARSTDEGLATRDALAAITYAPRAGSGGGAGAPFLDSTWHPVAVGGDTLFAVQLVPLAAAEFLQRRLERARTRIAVLLGIGVVLLLALAWRPASNLTRKLGAVGFALAVVAVFPLNTLSNRS
ncbi:MAG: hypothetical protein ACT4R6_09045, partial [Gemmatimonadaceae bacterium]